MEIAEDILVPLEDVQQDFSRVIHIVNQSGMAVISSSDKPQYMVLNFSEYSKMRAVYDAQFSDMIDDIIAENIVALKELAK